MMKRSLSKTPMIMLCMLIMLSTLVSCASNSGKTSAILPNAADQELAGGIVTDGGISGKPSAEDVAYERKIIRTVDISCETKVFDPAVECILTALTQHQGYVETSSVRGTGYQEDQRDRASARYASYTLRVPAEKLDAYLSVLRAQEGIRIIKQSSSSNEITGTYYDLTTRIETLELERGSLQEMLAGFTDYADIGAMLSVQERLYNVIEETESLKTQLKLYDDKVDMATVTISVNEVLVYTEAATPSFGERIGEAFSGSWTAFGKGCQNFAIGFVEAFPTLLVVGICLAVVSLLLKTLIKKHRSSKTLPKDPP